MSSATGMKQQGTFLVPPTRQQTSPQPGRAHRRRKGQRPLLVLLSLLGVIILLHIIAVRHAADPFVTPTNCMELIRTTDYTQVIHLQPQSQEMDAVQFVDQLINGQPAALVQVTNTGAQHRLDVYVYGCNILHSVPKLNELFTQRGLAQGTASVSQANTLITSQVDPLVSPQTATLLQPLQQNIYHEYAWHNGTFVQASFPGLYPVSSRGEAEALQQQANSGQTLPWSDPLVNAEQMAKDLLRWSSNDPQDIVLSNDGTTAQVKLVQQHPALIVTVTLVRLVQQNNTGLWFVVGAQTAGIALDKLGGQSQGTPIQQSQDQQYCANAQQQNVCSSLVTPIASPFMIQGTGVLADGQTTASLFDHTLTPLSSGGSAVLNVNASGGYSGAISYLGITSNQQGVLVIQSLPPGGSTEIGQVLVVGVVLG